MSLDGKLQNKYVGKAISIKSWSLSGSHFRHFTECSWGILLVFNRFTYIFSVALAASVSARELDTLARQNRLFFFFLCFRTWVPSSPITRRGLRQFAFLHVVPFSCRAWSSESAHACSQSDVMPCDRLRPRWAPRAPLPTPQAPPHPLPLAHHWAKISHFPSRWC